MAFSPLVTYSGNSLEVGYYFTTMKDLLTTIKDSLRANSDFVDINTWKRGVLPPVPAYPCIAILPVSERYPRIFAGGMYHVERSVNIEVVTFTYESKTSLDQCMDFVEKTKEHIQANTTWDDTAVNTIMGQERLGSSTQPKRGFIQSCVVPITVKSREFYPGMTIENTLVESSSKDLLDVIGNTIKTYKDTTLAKVKRYHVGTVKSTPEFPAVSVVEESEIFSHTWAGREGVTRTFQIFTWTKLSDRESHLDWNLDLVEELKDIFQVNRNFGGRCIDSNLTGIDYGVYKGGGGEYLYDSSLYLEALSMENL